jgi:hypothetical protein
MNSTATLERTGSTISPEAIERSRRYDERCKELAAAAGVLNATHGHLVDVAVSCLADSDHVGPGLHSFAQFLCWRLGVSHTTAKAIECVARRAEELPVLCATLRAGEISLEQAAVVARHVLPSFDASATELAKTATVTQLKAVLPAYGKRAEPKPTGSRVSVTTNEDGVTRVSGKLHADQGALLGKALAAMREDLWRQRKADAKAAAEEAGETAKPVAPPTDAESLAALAETALAARSASHPGSDRYLISYHLQATEDGHILLIDEHGMVVTESERRRILCDHQFECVLHDEQGTPLSVGRKTRHVNRRLRRAILHRHRGRCAVAGCDATRGLEVHHIVHWEDGGRTDTGNLVPLCRRHHRAHHQGELHVTGNADLPADVDGALHIGPPHHRLAPVGTPQAVDPTLADPLERLRTELHGRLGVVPPITASTPSGERLHRHTFHLEPDPESEPAPSEAVPHTRRQRHHHAPSGRRSPDGPPEAHGPPAA